MTSAERFRGTHEVNQLGADESCYLYQVRNLATGKKSRAWLTYELFPTRDSERTILLCEDATLLSGDDERRAHEHLSDALNTSVNDRVGRAKTIVNDIVDGVWRPSLVSVTVHKFGPVPAVVMRDPIQINVYGSQREVRLALFPKSFDKPSVAPSTAYAPFFVSSRQQFRRCLTLAPDLIFQRYLEDVGEEFHDIRRILKREDVYRRAKRVEQHLGQSVKTKLDLLIPRSSQVAKRGDATSLEAWEYFLLHSELLLEVAYGRCLALLLLNHMYQAIGLASREEHYKKRISEIPLRFQQLLGTEEMHAIEENSATLRHLRRTNELAAPVNVASVSRLLDHGRSAPNLWCAEFAKFAAFVYVTCEKIEGKPFARVFVSHHHDVGTTKVLRSQIEHLIREEYAPRVSSVVVEGLAVDSAFRHIVRSSIWASHGTVAICPTSTDSLITADKKKDYRWIAREVEHSIVLDRPLFIGRELDADLDQIQEDFANPSLDYLVTSSKLAPTNIRAKALSNKLNDHVNAKFSITLVENNKAALDPAMRAQLAGFFGNVVHNAAEEVLNGYVRQFEPDIAATIVRSLALLGPYGKKPKIWMVSQLAKAAGMKESSALAAFDAMTVACRKRRLHAGARNVSLIEFSRRRQRWGERLALVLWLLSPGVKVRDRKKWREAWIRQQCDRLRISFPSPRMVEGKLL